MDKVGKKIEKMEVDPPKLLGAGESSPRYASVPYGISFVTKAEKEAPNRMNINHRIKFFPGFFKGFNHICRQVFSHQLCGPISVAASVKYFGILLITANNF